MSPSTQVTSETRTSTITGVAFFTSEQGLLVGGSGGQGGLTATGEGVVWRTEDGGAHWIRAAVSPGPLSSVALVAGTSVGWASSVCGTGDPSSCRSELLATRDSGKSWQQIASIGFIALAFPNSTDGWGLKAAPRPTLETTDDGGRTWTAALSQPCPNVAPLAPAGLSFADPLHGWVACNGPGESGSFDKAIVATDDGGRSWRVLASAYPIQGYAAPTAGSIPQLGALWGIAMRPNGAGLIWLPLGGADGTWRTGDGGRTWSDLQIGAEPGTFGATSGWLLDDSTWFLVLDGTPPIEQLVRSTDAGRTWHPLATPS